MEDNNKTDVLGWKSDTLPIPDPIELDDVDEDALIIKRGNKNDRRV